MTADVDIFGKRNRALMHRYDILKMTQLDCKVARGGGNPGNAFIENVAVI